jgi:hypothetical protein
MDEPELVHTQQESRSLSDYEQERAHEINIRMPSDKVFLLPNPKGMAEEMLLKAHTGTSQGGFVDSGFRPNAPATDVLKTSNINSLEASLELRYSMEFNKTGEMRE